MSKRKTDMCLAIFSCNGFHRRDPADLSCPGKNFDVKWGPEEHRDRIKRVPAEGGIGMLKVFAADTSCFSDPVLRDGALAALSPHRREKVLRARRDQDRRLSLGAGAVLDIALASAGLREREVRLDWNSHGKPCLADHPELRFNLSHSGRFSVCALSDQEVGVDVEEAGEVREELIRRVCTERELAAMAGLDPEHRQDRFFQLWTAKESFLKYLGTGLGRPVRGVEVEPEPAASLSLDGRPQAVALFQRKLEGHWFAVCAAEGQTAEWKLLTERGLRSWFL